MMDQQLKQRLVGAAVLVALGVIFIPMLLDDSVRESAGIRGTNIPPKPEGEFSSSIIPLDAEPPEPAPAPGQQPAGAGGTKDSAPVTAAEPEPESEPETETETAKPPDRTHAALPEDTGTRVGLTAWVIQLGSFSSRENAAALEERLRSGGYSAFVEKVGGEDKPVYRVRVGPELMRSDAEALRDKLELEVKLKGIVVRYP